MHLSELIIDQKRFPTREAYPFSLPIFQQTKKMELTHPITIFTGENGSGKSTLLKALCRRCRIHIWEGVARSSYDGNQFEDMLVDTIDIKWLQGMVQGSFFSPELFRNYSHLVDEWAIGSPGILNHFGGSSLVTQSHGQSCMAYFKSIYKVKGIYFLDEPEAALSPKTQLDLLSLLTEISKQGHAQFIIATHSPILMSCNQAMLYSFDNDSIKPISYEETEHYKVYSAFFKGENGKI
ncbi:MAG: AAA family ATPase [Deltaproteobacteria bacterium]|jgi:predicted ATPase|nr:AAA family ATPase [Deltaproteobacteria bacterium]MBT4525715.1 AAA family ATPase [Deltaproteobacteria bacterium]